MTLSRLLLAVVMLGAVTTALAQADYAREQRWAEEITPAILVGEPLYLTLASGRRFLAIHAPQPASAPGVIVVHGIGVHPDWGLINTLRSELAERGYATLSVQMPVLAADAKAEAYAPLYPEAAERLQAAADFLRKAGHAKIAIVSHSLGSRMSDFFLGSQPPPRIEAWVAIGLSGAYTALRPGGPAVFDLYGERDLPAVLQHAGARARALKAVRGSAQGRVAGADHFFAGRERELVQHVQLFLDRALR